MSRATVMFASLFSKHLVQTRYAKTHKKERSPLDLQLLIQGMLLSLTQLLLER